MTEWEIFRANQLALLKLIKSQTGIYISGKGNVMKVIGELWRNNKIAELSANNNLNKQEKQYLAKLINKNNKKVRVIDDNGECNLLVYGKRAINQVIQYV